MKTNCWEAKQCGREPGGARVGELGVCPASVTIPLHGVNGGINGGRACWAIEKTLCGNEVQGAFSQKMASCMQCEFYSDVRVEEKDNYTGTQQIINLIKGQSESVKTPRPWGVSDKLDNSLRG